MITGKTASGFEFTLDEQAMDDMNLIDALAGASENDPLQFSRVIRLLLGEEQRKRLYNTLKNEAGRVPVERVSEAVSEIFAAAGAAGKNSSASR